MSTLGAVQTPTVAFSVMLFGPTLESSDVTDATEAAMVRAVAAAAGTDAALVSVVAVDWTIQAVFSFSSAPPHLSEDAMGSALEAALANVTGAQDRNTTLQVLGTNFFTARRRRLQAALEITILVANPELSAVRHFNTTLQDAMLPTNGSLTAALLAMGVNGSAVTLAVAHATGVEFHFLISCPPGVAPDGSPLPTATALFAAVSQGTLDTHAGFLADINAAGLGAVSSIAVSRLPILGAIAASGCACATSALSFG
jgi:hypothetical protein